MKIVINNCYGGFGISAKAVKRLAELNGKQAYFFKSTGLKDDDKYIPITLEEADSSIFHTVFSVPNPNEVLPSCRRDTEGPFEGTYTTYNNKYNEINLSNRDFNRADLKLIQVVEELGEEASGSCAKLKIIEIPDGVEYEIDEYDGLESVHEKHRSWH